MTERERALGAVPVGDCCVATVADAMALADRRRRELSPEQRRTPVHFWVRPASDALGIEVTQHGTRTVVIVQRPPRPEPA